MLLIDMDSNSGMPAKALDATEWRILLQAVDTRQKLVTMIMKSLEKFLLISEPEGLIELNKVAVRFEEHVFTAATSPSDYVQIISSKMLILETNGVANTLPSSTGGGSGSGGSQIPQDPASMRQQAPLLHLQQSMNALSLQHNQLIGQQSNVSSMPQQQQPGLLNPQNSIPCQQQLGQQSNMPGLQNQQQQPVRATHRQGGTTVQEQQKAQVSANSLQTQLGQQKPESSTSVDSGITGNTTATGNAVDAQEEIYQTLKSMREKYLPDLNDMHQRISQKCQEHDSLPQPPLESEQIEKFKISINTLDKMMKFLNLPKSSVLPSMKDQLGPLEKHILNILSLYRSKKPGPQQQQIQPTGGHPLFIQQQQLQQSQQHQQQILTTGGLPLFIQQQQLLQSQQHQQQIQSTGGLPLFIQQQQLQQLEMHLQHMQQLLQQMRQQIQPTGGNPLFVQQQNQRQAPATVADTI